MASNDFHNSDLASVLKTLSAYAPPTSQIATPSVATTQNNPVVNNGLDSLVGDDYKPQDTVLPDRPNLGRSLPVLHSRGSATPTPPPTFTSRKTPSIDPSAITEWPAALKCVMKTVAANEAIQARVQKLINTQHEYERQWWAGREALLMKQKGREEGKRKLDEVMRSVGGKVIADAATPTPEEDIAEVKRYDIKVYRASVEMARAMDGELRNLGVPFFAIKHELVATGRPPGLSSGRDGKGGNGAVEKGYLEKEELIKLQRKMLELLEDLCKD